MRDDVVLAQVLFVCFVKRLFGFDLAAVEVLPVQLQIPAFGDLRGFGEALFLGAGAVIFGSEVGGTLAVGAVLAFVEVDLAAEDRVRFCHKRCAARLPAKQANCVSYVQEIATWLRSQYALDALSFVGNSEFI